MSYRKLNTEFDEMYEYESETSDKTTLFKENFAEEMSIIFDFSSMSSNKTKCNNNFDKIDVIQNENEMEREKISMFKSIFKNSEKALREYEKSLEISKMKDHQSKSEYLNIFRSKKNISNENDEFLKDESKFENQRHFLYENKEEKKNKNECLDLSYSRYINFQKCMETENSVDNFYKKIKKENRSKKNSDVYDGKMFEMEKNESNYCVKTDIKENINKYNEKKLDLQAYDPGFIATEKNNISKNMKMKEKSRKTEFFGMKENEMTNKRINEEEWLGKEKSKNNLLFLGTNPNQINSKNFQKNNQIQVENHFVDENLNKIFKNKGTVDFDKKGNHIKNTFKIKDQTSKKHENKNFHNEYMSEDINYFTEGLYSKTMAAEIMSNNVNNVNTTSKDVGYKTNSLFSNKNTKNSLFNVPGNKNIFQDIDYGADSLYISNKGGSPFNNYYYDQYACKGIEINEDLCTEKNSASGLLDDRNNQNFFKEMFCNEMTSTYTNNKNSQKKIFNHNNECQETQDYNMKCIKNDNKNDIGYKNQYPFDNNCYNKNFNYIGECNFSPFDEFNNDLNINKIMQQNIMDMPSGNMPMNQPVENNSHENPKQKSKRIYQDHNKHSLYNKKLKSKNIPRKDQVDLKPIEVNKTSTKLNLDRKCSNLKDRYEKYSNVSPEINAFDNKFVVKLRLDKDCLNNKFLAVNADANFEKHSYNNNLNMEQRLVKDIKKCTDQNLSENFKNQNEIFYNKQLIKKDKIMKQTIQEKIIPEKDFGFTKESYNNYVLNNFGNVSSTLKTESNIFKNDQNSSFEVSEINTPLSDQTFKSHISSQEQANMLNSQSMKCIDKRNCEIYTKIECKPTFGLSPYEKSNKILEVENTNNKMKPTITDINCLFREESNEIYKMDDIFDKIRIMRLKVNPRIYDTTKECNNCFMSKFRRFTLKSAEIYFEHKLSSNFNVEDFKRVISKFYKVLKLTYGLNFPVIDNSFQYKMKHIFLHSIRNHGFFNRNNLYKLLIYYQEEFNKLKDIYISTIYPFEQFFMKNELVNFYFYFNVEDMLKDSKFENTIENHFDERHLKYKFTDDIPIECIVQALTTCDKDCVLSIFNYLLHSKVLIDLLSEFTIIISLMKKSWEKLEKKYTFGKTEINKNLEMKLRSSDKNSSMNDGNKNVRKIMPYKSEDNDSAMNIHETLIGKILNNEVYNTEKEFFGLNDFFYKINIKTYKAFKTMNGTDLILMTSKLLDLLEKYSSFKEFSKTLNKNEIKFSLKEYTNSVNFIFQELLEINKIISSLQMIGIYKLKSSIQNRILTFASNNSEIISINSLFLKFLKEQLQDKKRDEIQNLFFYVKKLKINHKVKYDLIRQQIETFIEMFNMATNKINQVDLDESVLCKLENLIEFTIELQIFENHFKIIFTSLVNCLINLLNIDSKKNLEKILSIVRILNILSFHPNFIDLNSGVFNKYWKVKKIIKTLNINQGKRTSCLKRCDLLF